MYDGKPPQWHETIANPAGWCNMDPLKHGFSIFLAWKTMGGISPRCDMKSWLNIQGGEEFRDCNFVRSTDAGTYKNNIQTLFESNTYKTDVYIHTTSYFS